MSEKRVLSEEERNYLVSLLDNRFLEYKKIIVLFNEKYPNHPFGSRGGFLHYLKRNNLYRGYQPYYKAFRNKEEFDFIVNLMADKTLTWKQISVMFWNKYRSGSMPKGEHKRIQERMTKTHKIRRPDDIINTGKFTSEKNRPRMKIGSEVKKQNYTWIKVADARGKGREDRNEIYCFNWKPKQEVIWNEHNPNDTVGESEIVIFLDGNTDNFNINNLVKIPRSIHAQLSKKRVHNNGIITLAMIEILKTENVLRGAKKL